MLIGVSCHFLQSYQTLQDNYFQNQRIKDLLWLILYNCFTSRPKILHSQGVHHRWWRASKIRLLLCSYGQGAGMGVYCDTPAWTQGLNFYSVFRTSASMFNRENYLSFVHNNGQNKGITKLSITEHQWNTIRYCVYITELYDWLLLLWFTPNQQYSSYVTSATMKNDRFWSFELSLAALANLLFFEYI